MKWKFPSPDPFIIGIILMIVVASIFPFRESYSIHFPLKDIIYWGITGIFFLYGLKLNPKQIRQDMSNWRLHILIQSATFLFFPLIILPFYSLFAGGPYENIWLAAFFLAALPSTVSSSVVMVSIAKGNIPSAIFNASISGLIGLIATPLWMSIFLSANGEGPELSETIQQLVQQILLPVALGLSLNKYLGTTAQKHKSLIGWFDKIIIFLIIYKSFSTAFLSGVFTQLPPVSLLLLAVCIIALFFLVFYSIRFLSRKFHFSREDTITALFCGSKKSLVHASVFVIILVTDSAAQSLFLLPVMVYHAFQLFYTSYLARKWGKEQ